MTFDFRRSLVEHAPALRRYARMLTRHGARADDLLQDCLERALSRAHQFRAGSNLKAWLFTIMHNLYVSEWRSARSTPTSVSLDDTQEHIPGVAHDHAEVDDILRAIATLAEEQREVMLLVCVEGWSYQEVAVLLNVPSGTVMSRLHRGRENLRALVFGANTEGSST